MFEQSLCASSSIASALLKTCGNAFLFLENRKRNTTIRTFGISIDLARHRTGHNVDTYVVMVRQRDLV